MIDCLKIPYIASFKEKYIIPESQEIDFDTVEICKRNKDGTLGEDVHEFIVRRNTSPNVIIPEGQIKDQKYFIKYIYSPKEDIASSKTTNKIYRDFSLPTDFQKHKEIALDLLKNNKQYETAKIVEKLFEDEMLHCQFFGVLKVDMRTGE